MLKKFHGQYDNLTIRGKFLLVFSSLIVLIILITISNAFIQVRFITPANQSLESSTQEMMMGKDFNFQFVQARNLEAQIITAYLAYGYQGVMDLYANHLPFFDNALSILDQLAENRNSAEIAGSTRNSEEKADIGHVRQLLEDYRAFLDHLQSGMLEHGNTTLGLGSAVINPLTEINDTVDAGEAITLASDYITKFDPKGMLTFPAALANLQADVEAADLSAAQKEELIGLIDESHKAFRSLLNLDAELIDGFTSLEFVGGPVSAAITEFIDKEVQEQRKAQDQLDDAETLQRDINIGIAILAVVVALTIAFFTSKSLSQPIVELAGLAERIADGIYDQRARVVHKDEVGQLALMFNKMIDDVSIREARLREQTDKLVVATARAREATRLKSEFLGNMSHELRTPLNAIIGYSDMLLMGMSGALNEKQEHKVERLRENGVRLLNLINDVLDLTRIEARRVEVILKPFEPRSLLYRLRGQMEVLASDKGLAFDLDIASDVPDILISDEKRVEQVVVNLLSNAFKFTPAGKVVLKSWINADNQTWLISVSDTGIGIPPHARSLIFEEFRQLDGAPTRAYKGTGLGLAITRNLVHIMGGQIGVESELGLGSTFTVSLPLQLEKISTPEPVEASHA